MTEEQKLNEITQILLATLDSLRKDECINLSLRIETAEGYANVQLTGRGEYVSILNNLQGGKVIPFHQ